MIAGGAFRRRTRLGLSALFLAVAAATTPFWRTTVRVLSPGLLSYRALRESLAFQGIPMDAIGSRLAGLLPSGEPVGFSPKIEEDPFLVQRFTEGLYPRRIDPRSRYRIDLVSPEEAAARGAVLLARRSKRMVVILEPAVPTPPAEPGPLPPLSLSWLALAGVVSSVLGIGLLARRLLPAAARPRGALVLPFSVIACALLFAVVATAGTVLQTGVPGKGVALLGAAVFAVVVLAAARTGWAAFLGNAARRPEAAGMALLVLLLGVRMARKPIDGWDGRSIWMFKAKQMFARGIIERADLLDPAYQFSHPHYPLLFPAWTSFFSSLSGGYDERMAALAIAALFAAATAAVWVLSRAALGRWVGAAFTAAAFVAVADLVGAGWVDALLAFLLLVEFLAFRRSQDALGWAAAGAASLVKREGLVLAALIALPWAAASFRDRSGRGRRLLPFLVFAPAAGFAAWAGAIGVKDVYQGIRWREDFREFGERAAVILRGVAGVMSGEHVNFLVQTRLAAAGAAAAAVAIVAVAIRRRRVGGTALLALALGLAFAAFDFAAMFLTTRDVRWHVGTALARLLILPSLFFVLAALAALGDDDAAEPPASASG